MEFPEFHLNEPYVLSPYKVCVAMYFSAFLEEYYIEFDSKPGPAKMIQAQLAFKLITSMDVSFSDLQALIVSYMNKVNFIPTKQDFTWSVRTRFEESIKEVQSSKSGIVKLHDCISTIGVATTPIQIRKNTILSHWTNAKKQFCLRVRIDPNSMMGLFLRKLKVHFDRLSYSDVMTLHQQLLNYLAGTDETDYLQSRPIDNSNKTPEADNKFEQNIQDKLAQVDLELFEQRFDSACNEMSDCHRAQIKIMLDKVKKMINQDQTSKPSDPSNVDIEQIKSKVLQASVVHDNVAENNSTDVEMSLTDMSMDIDMDISQAIKSPSNSIVMNLEATPLINLTSKIPGRWFLMNLTEEKKKLEAKANGSLEMSNLHPQYASQHFLVSQVQKIVINESAALPPGDLVRLIAFYFEQYSPFQYHRFIKLNYFANLSMMRENSAQSMASNLYPDRGNARDNSAGNGANLFHPPGTTGPNGTNANYRGVGLADLSGGMFGLSAVAHAGLIRKAEGTSKKSKDLFQAINFYSDIHYLKFVNSLRLMDYTTAQEYFYSYFDLKKYQRPPRMGWNKTLLLLSSMHSTNAPSFQSLVSSQPAQYQYMSHLLSSGNNFCWAGLNLAIMYAHFGHYRLAYDALADCITMARERKEERCLQFALLWMLIILQHFHHGGLLSLKSSSTDFGLSSRYESPHHDLHLTENLVGVILMSKASVPHIAGLAYLQLERLNYLRPIYPTIEEIGIGRSAPRATRLKTPSRVPLSSKPVHYAVDSRMDDLLGKSLMMRAAILNAYGASHEAALFSQLLLRLELSSSVAGQTIELIDENHAIAIRNLALYWWNVRGQAEKAINLLNRFRKQYRKYNTPLRVIIEQALAEIHFERALGVANWNVAARMINLIRSFDRNRALYMQAQLKRRLSEPMAALEFLEAIFTHNGSERQTIVGTAKASATGTSFFRDDHLKPDYSINATISVDQEDSVVVGSEKKASKIEDNREDDRPSIVLDQSNHESERERPLSSSLDPYTSVSVSLLKAMLLVDLNRLSEVLVTAKSHGFRQLEARTLLEIGRLQHSQLGQYVESQRIVNNVWVRLAAGGALRDMATAYHLTAANHLRLALQQLEDGGKPGGTSLNFVAMPVPLVLNADKNKLNALQVARWSYRRALLIWSKLEDKFELLDTLNLGAIIEHVAGDRDARNRLSNKFRLVRKQLLKC